MLASRNRRVFGVFARTTGKCTWPLRLRSLSTLPTPSNLDQTIALNPKEWSSFSETLTNVDTSNDTYRQHKKLLDTLSYIPKKVEELEIKAIEEDALNNYGTNEFRDDALAASERAGLFCRQLKVEEDQMADAAHNYAESIKNIMELGRGTGMKYVQRIALKWYEPLNSSIEREKKLILQRVSAKDRMQYGPVMLLLSTEKLTVITINTALNMILRTGNTGVSLVQVARNIGDLVEMEVNITKLQIGNSKLPQWQQDIIKEAYDEGARFRASLSKRIRGLLYDDAWSSTIKIKLGAALIKHLIECTKSESGEETFMHSTLFYASVQKRLGILRLHSDTFKEIAEKEMDHVLPRYLPMLVPPKAWNNRTRAGCYFRLRTSLMRTFSQSHLDALRRADMGPILEGLNYLGQVPWRINGPMLKIIKEAQANGLRIGELPPDVNVPMPLESDCYRLPSAVNTDPYKYKKKPQNKTKTAQLDGTVQTSKTPSDVAKIEGKVAPAGLVPDTEGSHNPASLDPNTPIFDERLYRELCKRIKTKNAELHSLRCDLQLKIWVAERFEDDAFYLPCNLDFRGRAYPVPQNLNHLGSDLCRGLLKFDEAKPLGEIGFEWLKVQLANVYGNNKQSLRERVNWVDQHMEDVFDSAKNPLDGNRWWIQADEPFQTLATCMEIVNAIESGDPSTYECSLPVHQDGSCNGLQHYAALGRDEPGAIAVNLMPSQVPQDVYTTVLDIVLVKIKADLEIPEDSPDPAERNKRNYALLVHDIVNRKVIKQTVMTSVYGVTKIGARAQIQARLEERLLTDTTMVNSPEADRELFEASRYVANLTLSSLQEMFSGAKEIMDWLGKCASLVAERGHVMSWISPLGLPVMQPYRKTAAHQVKTTMQTMTLVVEDEALPVSGQKQQSAFPPNFVHSLDATHMLMTALKMKHMDLAFASVHDSYWTHACDIPFMSVVLRECFVELYHQSILENLRDSLVRRYPEIVFPPVPAGGTLDLEKVKESIYFFH